jgi:hypothetical protein
VAVIVLPLLLDLIIVVLWLVILPTMNETPLQTIIVGAPDLGLLIILIALLALGWGALRTGLFVWTFARTKLVAT